jgi:GxxExxY protein
MLRDRLGYDVRPELDPEMDQLTEVVIGAAIEVHRVLGPGLPEAVYEHALCVELELRQIPFECQPVKVVYYKDRKVGEMRLDLLIRGKLVVELKAVDALLPIHKAQVITYLQVTQLQLALLINFNVRALKDGIRRVILTPD